MKEIQVYQQQEIVKAGRIPAELMPKNAEEALMISQSLPEQYFNSLNPKSMTDAINSISPGLSVYNKFSGETKTRALIVIMVGDLVRFFNVGKSMNAVQIAQTSDLIFDEYFYFNIEDFKLCFNLVKKGYFGQVYDRIDGQVILNWLRTYSNDRADNCFDANYNQHLGVKAGERTTEDFLETHAKNRIQY